MDEPFNTKPLFSPTFNLDFPPLSPPSDFSNQSFSSSSSVGSAPSPSSLNDLRYSSADLSFIALPSDLEGLQTEDELFGLMCGTGNALLPGVEDKKPSLGVEDDLFSELSIDRLESLWNQQTFAGCIEENDVLGGLSTFSVDPLLSSLHAQPASQSPPQEPLQQIPSFVLSHLAYQPSASSPNPTNSLNFALPSEPSTGEKRKASPSFSSTPSSHSSPPHPTLLALPINSEALSAHHPASSLPAPKKALPKSKKSNPTPGEAKVDGTGGKHPTDHNAIERKYRDNINDGFTRLRDSVPVLRVLFKTSTSTTLALDTPSPSGLIDGMSPETKQGKATVLGAAREYIFELQRERGKLRRYCAFLEEHLGKSEWEEFLTLDSHTVLDPYLQSITLSTMSSPSNKPPRKKSRSNPPGEVEKPSSSSTVSAVGGGTVLLALGLGVGVFSPFSSSSPAFGGDQSVGETEGRVLVGTGNPRLARRIESFSEGWITFALLGLVLVGLMAVWKPLRRRIQRGLSKIGRSVSALAGQPAKKEECKGTISLPNGFGALGVGFAKSWVGLGGEGGSEEREGWRALAGRELALPKGPRSYLQKLYIYRRLTTLTPASSPPSFSQAHSLLMLALLHSTLSGGELTSTSLHLWTRARDSLNALGSTNAGRERHVRILKDILRLDLKDVLMVCPEVLEPLSSPSKNLTVAKEEPIEKIVAALAIRDLESIWQTLFLAFAPPSSSSSVHPTILESFRLPALTKTKFAPSTLLHTPSIMSSPNRKQALSKEIAALVASTLEGTKARELAITCLGAWSWFAGEEKGYRWAWKELGRLNGEDALGKGARVFREVVVNQHKLADRLVVDEETEEAEESEGRRSSSIIRQIETISTFLITYQAFLHSLPASPPDRNLTSSPTTPTESTFSSPPINPSPPSETKETAGRILQTTLKLRAMLRALDRDEPEGVDQGALEVYGARLYRLGRWAVGWEAGEDEEEDEWSDSGFGED